MGPAEQFSANGGLRFANPPNMLQLSSFASASFHCNRVLRHRALTGLATEMMVYGKRSGRYAGLWPANGIFLIPDRVRPNHRISNDCAVHLLRVDYSDQRDHKLRVFNSGGSGCDRHCPYDGTLCLCEKRGFDDRERGTISNGVDRMAAGHSVEHDRRSGL